MNRRRALQALSSLAPLAALSGRARAQQQPSATDRVGFALVGAGNRGLEVARAMLATKRFTLTAVCDVWDERRTRARRELAPEAFESPLLADVLARQDVDAVLVATPDHQHLDNALAVLAARKPLYLEKPTTHALAEGPRLAAAARAAGVVIQTGTQQRSGAHFRRAREEIFARGRLGKVLFTRATWADFGRQRRTFEAAPVPAGLDWKRWLGRAPSVAYHPMRYETWRYYPEYGGGLLADIFTHWADVAQWMMDDARPLCAVASGGTYQLNDGRKNPDTVNAIVQYRGWNLTFESTVLPVRTRAAVTFVGTEGTLEIARDGWTFSGKDGTSESVKAEGSLDEAHAAAFHDAIVRAQPATAPLEVGLESVRPVHLALAAYWRRARTTFTPDLARVIVERPTAG